MVTRSRELISKRPSYRASPKLGAPSLSARRKRGLVWHVLDVALAIVALSTSLVACHYCANIGCPICSPLPGDSQDDAGVAFDSDARAPAFVLWGSKWPQENLGDPVTITYSYNNMFDGGLKGPNGEPLSVDLIRTSIEQALQLWANVAPLNFVEVEDEGGPVIVGNYADGDYGQIRFHHRFINGPDVPGQQPTTKAQAFFPNAITNNAGDVYYDNGDPWQAIGELDKPDILGATIHELGHSLGLAHTDIPEANMYWVFQRSQGLGTGELHPDDIAGIQALYGVGVGSVVTLQSIPEPAAFVLVVLLTSAVLSTRYRRAA